MYMYVWFFITNLLHSLFAKIPEITNDLILEVAFRKLEKLPSLYCFEFSNRNTFSLKKKKI